MSIVNSLTGGVIGLVVGSGLGILHYPMFRDTYPSRIQRIYDNNGGILNLTALGGGIGGCIGGIIGGYNDQYTFGIIGGLAGGAIGSVAGGTIIIMNDSNKVS